jgi:hypothetical protein
MSCSTIDTKWIFGGFIIKLVCRLNIEMLIRKKRFSFFFRSQLFGLSLFLLYCLLLVVYLLFSFLLFHFLFGKFDNSEKFSMRCTKEYTILNNFKSFGKTILMIAFRTELTY